MPVKPENKNRYPKNWKQIRERICERARDKCEWCGAVNYSFVNHFTRQLCLRDEPDTIKIVCTVAHLDHVPENCDEDNLRFLCQKCHNRYDAPHRVETRRNAKMKNQMMFIF